MSIRDRVRLIESTVLADDWGVLRKNRVAWRRGDGDWQEMLRETYDRGNGAAILPYDPARGTVLLVRQFRYPAWVNGADELLVEAAAGLLDDAAPAERIRAEAEEELGLRLREVTEVFQAYMSPGSVTELLHFFVAQYDAADRIGAGGGVASEGEDIEVLEMTIDAALGAISDGSIRDAKAIMLLQYAALHLFERQPS